MQSCAVPLALQIVIGTHGRVKSFIQKRLMPVNSIKLLVFDDADEIF